MFEEDKEFLEIARSVLYPTEFNRLMALLRLHHHKNAMIRRQAKRETVAILDLIERRLDEGDDASDRKTS